MKNTDNQNQSMEDKYGVTEITEENKHLFPDLANALEDLEKNKGKIHFPEKYFKAQKEDLQYEVRELWEKSPELPVKQVVLNLMKDLPDFLPAENLVEVTKIITSTWEDLKKKKLAA